MQYSSTGEQKIILISLIFRHCDLMQYIYNQPPILLLDDIIEHLDEKHTTALFKKHQVIMHNVGLHPQIIKFLKIIQICMKL